MDYRVEQLAARTGVSVDTVRFYQSRGLLPAPRRQGRVALYDDDHVQRIERIRHLQARGFSLATIRRLLSGELDAADEALVAALGADRAPGDEPERPEELLSLGELAERSGVPLPLLEAVEREGMLVPRRVGSQVGFTPADADVVAEGLKLVAAGLPLPEVLGLARRHHAAMRAVADEAVALFDAHVRQPLRQAGLPDDESAARLVDAFNTLLPATTQIVAHHFRRVLLAVAQEHIDHVGDDAERTAVAAESTRRLEVAWPA